MIMVDMSARSDSGAHLVKKMTLYYAFMVLSQILKSSFKHQSEGCYLESMLEMHGKVPASQQPIRNLLTVNRDIMTSCQMSS